MTRVTRQEESLEDSMDHRLQTEVERISSRQKHSPARSRVHTMTSAPMARTLCVAAMLATASMMAHAQSVARMNQDGNQLYDQGEYEQAEKVYSQAQAEAPEKPELYYNLGNALIRQKKFDQGIQALRQSNSKGGKGLQQSGWFNTGHAMFQMEKYPEAVEAFSQALRINPADPDAKHNLELALQKLEQQNQNQSGKDQDQDQDEQDKNDDSSQDQGDSQDQDQQNSPDQQQGEQQQQDSTPQESPSEQNDSETASANPEDSGQAADPKSTESAPRDGTFTKEQALQLLDALANQELADQRKRQERRARTRTKAKDW